jgi:hypothetical protein
VTAPDIGKVRQASFSDGEAGTFEVELALFKKVLFDREVSKMKFFHGLRPAMRLIFPLSVRAILY